MAVVSSLSLSRFPVARLIDLSISLASVGQFAVQLAQISGYKVVATASPRNISLVKSLGADVVLDYHDASVLSQIKSATGDSVKAAFDTIALKDTQELCVRALAPEGGKVVIVLGPAKEAQVRDDVTIIRTYLYFHSLYAISMLMFLLTATLIYTSLGRTFKFAGNDYPASAEDKAQLVSFLKKVPQLVKDGQIKANPIKLWEGGLASISDGLQYMREGKVSAEKIVYRVQ